MIKIYADDCKTENMISLSVEDFTWNMIANRLMKPVKTRFKHGLQSDKR